MAPRNSSVASSRRIVVEQTSLAHLVLDVVAQLQIMLGEESTDPELAGIALREISLSIPFESDNAEPLPALADGRALSLAEARTYLLENDRQVWLEHPRLELQPSSQLLRLNVRIQL